MPSCSALLATRLAQRLPLSRRAEQLDKLYRDQPDNALLALKLSQAYAAMGEKDLSLRISERAITLRPRAKDMVNGPGFEENLAFIQVMLGETSSAISTLTELLQTPYDGYLYPWDVTPALIEARSESGTFCAPIPLSKNIFILPV